MNEMPDPLLADAIHETMLTRLPHNARYAVVWVETEDDGTIDLATATLNCVANVPADVLTRFGQMMSSRPTEALFVRAQTGSS